MSALRRIATMAGVTVFRAYRSPGDLVALLVLPVVLSVVISTLFTGQGFAPPPQLVVVNEDGTEAADTMTDALAATPFDVSVVSRSEAVREIAAGTREMALVIPAGFAESVHAGTPRLEVLRGEGYAGGEREARATAVAEALAAGEVPAGPIIAHETPRGMANDGEFQRVLAVFGIYLVFALTALITRAGALQKERREGRLQRTLAAGVPYREVVAAHVLSILLIGLLQAGVVLTITGWLGIPWLSAGWSAIVLPVIGSLFAGAGIAVAISGFARSATQVQVLSAGAPSLLAMLGGAFFPMDVAPAKVQQMAVVNPVYWSIEALGGGLVYDGIASQVVPLSVLLFVGVLGTVVGIQGLRRMAL